MKQAARAQRIAHEEASRLAERRRRRLGWIGGGCLAAVAIAVVVALAVGGGSSSATGHPSGARDVAALYAGIPQHGTLLGSPRAPLTLTEFGDLQCPFCGHYARDVLPTIVRRYVRTGKVRLDFKILTFIGPDSDKAGRMTAAAADQNKLWNFIELFYRNQGEENSGYVTDGFLRRIGAAIPGLDVSSALATRDSAPVSSRLAADGAQADRYGVQSTPSFLITRRGGQPQKFEPSQLDVGTFEAQLDRELRAG
jgi:protein-disulfide isomerase